MFYFFLGLKYPFIYLYRNVYEKNKLYLRIFLRLFQEILHLNSELYLHSNILGLPKH